MTENQDTQSTQSFTLKELIALVIVTVLVLGAIVLHSILFPRPTFEEARAAIVAEHPECSDQVEMIKKTWVMPSLSGNDFSYGTHSLAVCEEANVRIIVLPE